MAAKQRTMVDRLQTLAWIAFAALVIGILAWRLVPRTYFWISVGLMSVVMVTVLVVGTRRHGLAFFGMAAKATAQGYAKLEGTLQDDASQQNSNDATVPRLTSHELAKLKNAVGTTCERPRCTQTTYLTVHHVKEWSTGGTNALSNLVVLCRNCHAQSGPNGGYSKAQQRQWASRSGRFRDKSFESWWKKTVVPKRL